MSTDTLFEQHTIKEIQETEKKLRNDIEQKKEELRQMVGERYRDLMEAADTITEMKQTAENVTFHINTMESHFIQLQQRTLMAGIVRNVECKVIERVKKNKNLYTVTALIEILMNSPVKIWRYLGTGDHLSALLLFLLTRHTYSVLVLDPFYSERSIQSYFPIVMQQWTAVLCFKPLLLKESRAILGFKKVKAEDVVGPLCCIILLSDASLQKVLQELLSARKMVAFTAFKPEKVAKTQICELVAEVENTLKIVHTLFYPEQSTAEDLKTNMLQDTIQSTIRKDLPGPVSLLDPNSTMFQYLPEDIRGYRPDFKASSETVSVEHLQKTCIEWIQNVSDELRPHMKELLNYVTTVKGLALIREAVADCSCQESQWDVVCDRLLKKKFSIWDYFLRESFIERVKDIIGNQTQLCSRSCKEAVERICAELQDEKHGEMEECISSYVWKESESDLAPNLGWVPHHQRHLWDSGTLGMKAYSLTPKIQSICSGVNRNMKDLMNDVSCFAPCEKKQEFVLERSAASLFDTTNKFTSERDDFNAICSHMTDITQKCFNDVANHFEDNLNSFVREESKGKFVSCLVFLGHLCHGLTKLCPHLMQCLLQGNLDNPMSKQGFLALSNTNRDDKLWQSLKNKLLALSDQTFGAWSKVLTKEVVSRFVSNLAVCSETGILKALLQWDKIEIQEESEEGNAVKSVLRIPQQVSVPLHNALFQFCLELSRIGGHALSRHVRSEIQEEFFLLLLNVYKLKTNASWSDESFSPHLAQTQALQLFFDVQFLVGLMGPRENADSQVSETSKEILAKITSQIDPFDMDVFSSHLQSNLKKALQKSVLLFGLSASTEQFNYLSSLKLAPPSGHIEHNLMLMPGLSSRLPLLPFAVRATTSATSSSHLLSQSSMSSHAQVPTKIARSHSSSPNLNASDNPSSVLKSSSFYDRVTAMSSSWFGGT